MNLFSSAIKLVKKVTKPTTNNGPVIYVYDWQTAEGSFCRALFPSAINIKADIAQKNKYILRKARKPDSYFLFHINLTETNGFFDDTEALCQQLKLRNITCFNKDVTNISKN